MSQGNAEAAALRQDTRDLSDRTIQVEDIMETHERSDEICGASSKRKRTCITEDDSLALRLVRHARERRRRIDAEDAVASLV